MNKLEIAKAKSLRGEIVKSLYEFCDIPIPINKIEELLMYKSFYNKNEIKRAVSYLAGEGKKFVSVEVNKKDYWASFIQLTPVGMNLAEGDRPDVGVLFSE